MSVKIFSKHVVYAALISLTFTLGVVMSPTVYAKAGTCKPEGKEKKKWH